jgi:hypothetical protein
MDAPCKAPLICCCNTIFIYTGIPTCYWRAQLLKQYGNYPQDYMCWCVQPRARVRCSRGVR